MQKAVSRKRAIRKATQRGKAHSPDVKAQAIALLLAGASVSEVMRATGLPQATVSTYKAEIPEDQFDRLRAVKGEQLDEKVYDYMVTNLKSLQAQAEVAGDPEFLRKMSARELAALHGGMFNQAVRFLEATTHRSATEGAQPDDDADV